MRKSVIFCLTLLCILSLSACSYFTKKDAGTIGGGAAGALIGSRIDSGTGRSIAIATGAVAGSLIGGRIGQAMDRKDQRYVNRALEKNKTNQTTSWQNPDTGNQYAVTPVKATYEGNKEPCREYITKAWIDGKQQKVYGAACRKADGSWQVQK